MEQLAELNHSLLSKLPLGVQSVLKSLPFSDLSLLILAGLVVIGVVYLLFCCGSSESFTQEFGEYKREKKEVNVKVNTPNPKKNVRRSKKRKETPVTEERKEERKVEIQELSHTEEGWEPVKAKKPKRKNE